MISTKKAKGPKAKKSPQTENPDKIDDEYDYEAKYEKPMQSTTLRAATGLTKPANITPIKVTPRSRQTSNR